MGDIKISFSTHYSVGDKFIVVCGRRSQFRQGSVVTLGDYMPILDDLSDPDSWAFDLLVKGSNSRFKTTIKELDRALMLGIIVIYNELTKELYGI